MSEIREPVEWFAQRMERVLARHDDKGGWSHESPFDFIRRIKEETRELEDALVLAYHHHELVDFEVADNIIDEAVDVANFAMMVADICRQIQSEQNRRAESEGG